MCGQLTMVTSLIGAAGTTNQLELNGTYPDYTSCLRVDISVDDCCLPTVGVGSYFVSLNADLIICTCCKL